MDTSQKLSHYRYLAMLFPVLMLLLLGGWAGSAAVLAQWEATAVPTVTNPVATQPPQPGVLQINWEALLAFVNRPDVRSILNVLVPVVTVILTVLGIFNTKFISMDKHIHEAGALAECCETTVGGRPYRNLSTAERITSGIEIAGVLSRYYGVSLPLWIDHVESILDVMPSEAQQIKLVVSADHPALTLQLED